MESTGNEYIDDLLDSIDAAMFSGDTFNDHRAALVLQKYLHRWERGLLKNFIPEGQTVDYDTTVD